MLLLLLLWVFSVNVFAWFRLLYGGVVCMCLLREYIRLLSIAGLFVVFFVCRFVYLFVGVFVVCLLIIVCLFVCLFLFGCVFVCCVLCVHLSSSFGY